MEGVRMGIKGIGKLLIWLACIAIIVGGLWPLLPDYASLAQTHYTVETGVAVEDAYQQSFGGAPCLVHNPNGLLFAAYCAKPATQYEIHVDYSADDGVNWSTMMSTAVGATQYHPSMVIVGGNDTDVAGDLWVAWGGLGGGDFPTQYAVKAVHYDYSEGTWGSIEYAYDEDAGGAGNGQRGSALTAQYDPVHLAIDGDNNLYCAFIWTRDTGTTTRLVRSEFDSSTGTWGDWENEGVAGTAPNKNFVGWIGCSLAIDGENDVGLATTSNTDAWFYLRDADTGTWAAGQSIDGTNTNGNIDLMASTAGGNTIWRCAYFDSAPNEIHYRERGGGVWGAETTLFSGLTNGVPVLAQENDISDDTDTGDFYCITYDKQGDGANHNWYYKKYTLGVGWGVTQTNTEDVAQACASKAYYPYDANSNYHWNLPITGFTLLWADADGNNWNDGDESILYYDGLGAGYGNFPPVVYTLYVGNLTGTTATFTGFVAGANPETITTRGFQYNTSASATGASTVSSTGTFGLGQFQEDAGGLTENEVYYFRAYATNAQGTGYGNWIGFASEEEWGEGTGTAVIETKPANYVSVNSARLNAYLKDDGGEPCACRFQYCQQGGTISDNSTTWYTPYTTGETPYQDITGLTPSTTYVFRAQAWNSSGIANSANTTFTTLSTMSPPCNCTAIPRVGEAAIDLTWVKGSSTATSYIRYKIGEYPTSTTDGTQAGSDLGVVGNSFGITGLDAGTTYYFRIWGQSGGNYTSGNATCFATTYAKPAAASEVDTSLPSSWFFDVDYTRLSAFPLYTMFNLGFEEYSLPYNTAWFMVVLFFVMVAGLGVYSLGQHRIYAGRPILEPGTYSLLLSIAFMLASLGILSGLRIVPGMYVIIFAMVVIGIGVVVRRF